MSVKRLICIGLVIAVWQAAGQYGGDPNPPLREVRGRGGVPTWQTNEEFPHDVFRFVRLRYRTLRHHFRTHWSGDYPSADLNFSYRLQQLTSIKVNPDPLLLDIVDERLFDYPFTFMSSAGAISLDEDEVEALTKYFRNGGFLMVDDVWGREHLEHFKSQIAKVFPGLEPKNLPLSHPIFKMVYPLTKKPQIPSINAWNQGLEIEPWHGDMTDSDPHYLAYLDEDGNIMLLICHNTDIADGWEREGEDEKYFALFSEPWSYPIGVNIVIYALTH